MHPMRQLISIITEAHGIQGLPDDAEVDDELHHMLTRGYRGVATPRPKRWSDSGETYDLELHPQGNVASFKRYPKRADDRRVSYYDPELADLKTFDPDDEILARTHAKLKPTFTDTIEPLPGDNIIYRGMSAEEYAFFQRTGKIESIGDYNIGDEQRGLTYWTTQPESAVSYANSFAPQRHKPTFQLPAYVVAAKRPKETRHVAGVGEHEVGVARPITADEVLAVWRGRVYSLEPGWFELRGSPDGKKYRQGSATGVSTGVAWDRIE